MTITDVSAKMSGMRIATGGIRHESNTFSSVGTDWHSFATLDTVSVGEQIFERFAGTRTVTCGFMDESGRRGIELIPLIWARSTPSAAVSHEAYERLRRMLLDRLASHPHVDGVLLDLHGAMVTTELDDAEGDILSVVRGVVGADVPIVATLDLHTNMTARMVDAADVLVGFDTYPHVDMYERGIEAVEIMHRILRDRLKPTMAYVKLPLLWSVSKQITAQDPMKDVMERVHEVESEDGVVNVTVSTGFPYADIEQAGASVTVTTADDVAGARGRADELADFIWERRRDWQDAFISVEEGIRRGEAGGAYPVVLADVADSPGGGGSCDGTEILRVFLDLDVQDAVVAVIADPESVARADGAGVGHRVDLVVGGKTDRLHGDPVRLSGHVSCICDGRFVLKGPMNTGTVENMGRTAVVKSGGTEVILTERRVNATFDAELLRSLGIDPMERRFIGVKSGVHFRASYGPIAGAIYEVDTPGTNTCRFERLPYRRIRRPIYPLDDYTTFTLTKRMPRPSG